MLTDVEMFSGEDEWLTSSVEMSLHVACFCTSRGEEILLRDERLLVNQIE